MNRTAYYIYKDFTDAELDEVVRVMNAPEGQAEAKVILADITNYTQALAISLLPTNQKLTK